VSIQDCVGELEIDGAADGLNEFDGLADFVGEFVIDGAVDGLAEIDGELV